MRVCLCNSWADIADYGTRSWFLLLQTTSRQLLFYRIDTPTSKLLSKPFLDIRRGRLEQLIHAKSPDHPVWAFTTARG